MKYILSKLLIFIFILHSTYIFADEHIVKIITKNGLQSEENIWIKDSVFKYSWDNYSIVIDCKNKSILYENKIIRATWSGNFEEFFKEINAFNDKSTPKNNNKKKTNIAEKEKISEQKETMNILGFDCRKFEVTKNGEKIEEFYHTNNLNLLSGIDIQKIQDIMVVLMRLMDNSSAYQYSNEYIKYLESGTILKSEQYSDSTKNICTAEIIIFDYTDLDRMVFYKTEKYITLSLPEILEAQKQITKEENERTAN